MAPVRGLWLQRKIQLRYTSVSCGVEGGRCPFSIRRRKLFLSHIYIHILCLHMVCSFGSRANIFKTANTPSTNMKCFPELFRTLLNKCLQMMAKWSAIYNTLIHVWSLDQAFTIANNSLLMFHTCTISLQIFCFWWSQGKQSCIWALPYPLDTVCPNLKWNPHHICAV